MSGTIQAQLMDIPVLPLRGRVLLPGSPLRLSIGRAASINLVQSIWSGLSKFKSINTLIVIVAQRPPPSTNGKDSKGTSSSSGNNQDGGDLSVSVGPSDSNSASSQENSSTVTTTTLFSYGTLARISQLQKIKATNASYSMIVTGIGRVRIDDYLTKEPYLRARVTLLRDRGKSDSLAIKSLASRILFLAQEILGAAKTNRNGSPVPLSSLGATKQFLDGLQRLSPGTLADLLVSTLKISVPEKQKILETIDIEKRLELALSLLEKQNEMTKVTNQISAKVTNKLKSSQREYYLREQLKAIKEELGELKGSSGSSKDGGEENVLEALKNKLSQLNLSKEARETVDREIARASKMNPAQPEHSIIINYLQWMSELPWNTFTVDSISIDKVQAQLDDDHYGLQKVKTRLVEFLAVKQLHERLQRVTALSDELNELSSDSDEEGNTEKNKTPPKARPSKGPSTILCLVGPPGVGKTSLGTSVATALGRSFYRMALGGVHDEAELRGHRRTYIGAMPGNIIQGLKKAGTSNPVFLLDEIDKMGRDQRGDPTAALLEILDPAQNHSFVDHYLNVPFDLSEVLFIATANNIDTIPPPLRDRMEIIQLPGYTLNEKIKISKRHLVSKAIEKHALKKNMIDISDDSLRTIITGYTREAGVRTLERQISALCRRIAVMVAKQLPSLSTSDDNGNEQEEGKVDSRTQEEEDHTAYLLLQNIKPTTVDQDFIIDVLGPNIFESEAKLRVTKPGVATGMAWTQVGGELLFIEATQMPGNGRLQITGNVKDVMRESCQASLSWLKSNAGTLFASLFESSKKDEGFGHDGSDRTLAARSVATNVMNNQIFQRKDIHVHFPAGKHYISTFGLILLY
jgi:ATP-dependent Lon protease